MLRTRGALALGECSYGIYLLHGIVLTLLFVEGAGLNNVLSTTALPILLPLAGLVIACITPLTYLAIERPAIQVGFRIARRLTGRRVSAVSPQAEVAP